MKYLKYFESNIDFDQEHDWEEETEEDENEKSTEFIKRMEDIIQEMEEVFAEGEGDQSMEPDDANVAEQMDEIVIDLNMNIYDIKDVIKKINSTKYLKHYIHLLEP
jgi:signal recognition particle GTPase